MSGSRTVRVVKRDGSVEAFDRPRLAAALHRAMEGTPGTFGDARELAWAIEIYAGRRGWPRVSSAAIFEMSLKVLRRVRLRKAAQALERHRIRRARRRRWFRIHHGCGQVTVWDKAWVREMARVGWHVSPTAGRILAAEVEQRLLERKSCRAARQEVVDLLNECVAAFGLADAVPLSQAVGVRGK